MQTFDHTLRSPLAWMWRNFLVYFFLSLLCDVESNYLCVSLGNGLRKIRTSFSWKTAAHFGNMHSLRPANRSTGWIHSIKESGQSVVELIGKFFFIAIGNFHLNGKIILIFRSLATFIFRPRKKNSRVLHLVSKPH